MSRPSASCVSSLTVSSKSRAETKTSERTNKASKSRAPPSTSSPRAAVRVLGRRHACDARRRGRARASSPPAVSRRSDQPTLEDQKRHDDEQHESEPEPDEPRAARRQVLRAPRFLQKRDALTLTLELPVARRAVACGVKTCSFGADDRRRGIRLADIDKDARQQHAPAPAAQSRRPSCRSQCRRAARPRSTPPARLLLVVVIALALAIAGRPAGGPPPPPPRS